MPKMVQEEKGYTLLEILLVVAIVGIISGIIYGVINIPDAIEKTNTTKAIGTLYSIAIAAKYHALENEAYADDTSRGEAAAFTSYINPAAWPTGPFEGSSYDWDNWLGQTCWDGSDGGVQVSLRDIDGYKGNNDYVLYYVIEGAGIPHCSEAATRGECVNCPDRYP